MPRVAQEWTHNWARRGLSKVCALCQLLSPAAHCNSSNICRKCTTARSRGESHVSKAMALAQPAALLGLTYLEKRLISFMR
eukprot:4835150-Amphidinium_carterae.1